MALDWKVVHGGNTPPPGEVVYGQTSGCRGAAPVGLSAQHVMAMYPGDRSAGRVGRGVR